MDKILRIILFFPSVTFSLIAAEVFPWGLIYVLSKKKAFRYRELMYVIILLLSAIITVYNDSKYGVEAVRSFIAYLNPLLLFFVLMNINKEEIIKLKSIIKYILVIFFIVAVLQYLSILRIIDPILSFLVPRGSSEVVAGGRGVSVFSSEPSRASLEYVFLYAAFRSFGEYSKRRYVLFDILVMILVVGLLRSATGLFLLIIFYYFIYGWKIILYSILVYIPVIVYFDDSRVYEILNMMIAANSVSDLSSIIINTSGFRVASIIGAYNNLFYNIIGFGVGAWQESSIKAMENAGLNPVEIAYFRNRSSSDFISVRPTSYFANISLDLGVLGVIMIICVLYPYFKEAYSQSKDIRSLLFLFLFSFIFVGSVGDPVPWVALSIAIRYAEYLKSDSLQILLENNTESGVARKKWTH